MRFQYALGPVLVMLLILGTTTATTMATQATTPAAAVQPMTPVAVSVVSGAAEDALREPIVGPGSESPAPAVLLQDPGAPPVPTATHRSQPNPARGVVTKAIPKPKPKPHPKAQPKPASHHRVTARRHVRHATHVRSTGHALRGLASWYCNNNGSRAPISSCHYQYPDTSSFNAYAAAGPKLRAAMGGNWRGRIVSVNGLRVKLVDWCQCYKGRSYEKLIDLYRDVYAVVGGSVTIRW